MIIIMIIINFSFVLTLLLMDSVTLAERSFAPSENVSVKGNTTVYGNVVFNGKTFAQSKHIQEH